MVRSIAVPSRYGQIKFEVNEKLSEEIYTLAKEEGLDGLEIWQGESGIGSLISQEFMGEITNFKKYNPANVHMAILSVTENPVTLNSLIFLNKEIEGDGKAIWSEIGAQEPEEKMYINTVSGSPIATTDKGCYMTLANITPINDLLGNRKWTAPTDAKELYSYITTLTNNFAYKYGSLWPGYHDETTSISITSDTFEELATDSFGLIIKQALKK